MKGRLFQLLLPLTLAVAVLWTPRQYQMPLIIAAFAAGTASVLAAIGEVMITSAEDRSAQRRAEQDAERESRRGETLRDIAAKRAATQEGATDA